MKNLIIEIHTFGDAGRTPPRSEGEGWDFLVIATVDGSEIQGSPVDMEKLPLFLGFHTCQVVVGDFWTINSITRRGNIPIKKKHLSNHSLKKKITGKTKCWTVGMPVSTVDFLSATTASHVCCLQGLSLYATIKWVWIPNSAQYICMHALCIVLDMPLTRIYTALENSMFCSKA